jgi:transcriptional regulator with XRE-family HTH domain
MMGLTQAGLAIESGVSRRRLGLIERGLARPTSKEADRLIAVLSRCERTLASEEVSQGGGGRPL